MYLLSPGQNPEPGYFNFLWEEDTGKIWLDVQDRWGEEFLYVHSMTGGIGSNDIGLDRNQLGASRIVRFERIGPRALLVQPNYRYRAVSTNADERRSIEEAFARSVVWGFKIEKKLDRDMIDLTPLLLHDAHGVARRLESTGQGTYKADENRSAVNRDRTKNFPRNTEFDALVTFTGEAKGVWIRSVAPTPEAVTVYLHHSFIALPDDGYTPRRYDTRSGFIPLTYADYASPVDQPLEQRLILRHRLQKKDPSAERSEPVEPIIYYIDPGCPEPVRSALIDGALWWNEAFGAAGFINAFQVRDLPEGADPMDVRYNMINWVHRATRGWSYGSSIVDPRTGEILKGHVLLGSLRVRQDYLIAQGLDGIFEEGDEDTTPLVEMALARLRQLSAHEVGHTIGLMHNFAASVNDRASVMDYPHPYITLRDDGSLDFSAAYDDRIGAWDIRAIMYGYSEFSEGADEDTALDAILAETIDMGLLYMTDADARPAGSAHPQAHLWDNGADAVAELARIRALRQHALSRYGEHNIPKGMPVAYLGQVLVPLYLSHRYQTEAVAKLIGGVAYTYQVRGDGQSGPHSVAPDLQRDALLGLLGTLDPGFLQLDTRILELIPPQPAGYGRHRELFNAYTGLTLDALAIAESSAGHTLQMLLHPERLARIHQQHLYNPAHVSLSDYLIGIRDYLFAEHHYTILDFAINHMVQAQFVVRLLDLAGDQSIQPQVAAAALLLIERIQRDITRTQDRPLPDQIAAHQRYLTHLISSFRERPESFVLPKAMEMPPGAPIGCTDW